MQWWRSVTCVALAGLLAVIIGVSTGKGSTTVVFVAIELFLLPISGAGAMIVASAVVIQVHRTGMSATALGPLAMRYVLHEVGARHDEGAKVITQNLFPRIGLQALFGPTLFAINMSGMSSEEAGAIFLYPPILPQNSRLRGISALLSTRTHIIDRQLEVALSSIDQIVVLGAGFDSKIYRISTGNSQVRMFEVDTNRTQPIKKKMLAASHLDVANVSFVEIDFNTDDWFSSLKARGFEQEKRTFFVWEGVTYYLPPAVVDATLSKIASCGSGSVVALDYASLDLVNGDSISFFFVTQLLRLVGEPLLFGVNMAMPSRDHAATWMNGLGLEIVEQTPLMTEAPGRTQAFGVLVAVVP